MAGLKRMMGGNLGNRVEGTAHEVLDARATNAPTPFPIVCDEHGVFLVPGDTAVLWGQARSLGAFMVSAGQDCRRTTAPRTRSPTAHREAETAKAHRG